MLSALLALSLFSTPSFAAAPGIEDLVLVSESGISAEQMRAKLITPTAGCNYPNNITSGNFPNVYNGSSMPASITAGSIPSAYSNGNYPGTYTVGHSFSSRSIRVPMPAIGL